MFCELQLHAASPNGLCILVIGLQMDYMRSNVVNCRGPKRRYFLSFKDTVSGGKSGCVMLLHISKELLGLTGSRTSSE